MDLTPALFFRPGRKAGGREDGPGRPAGQAPALAWFLAVLLPGLAEAHTPVTSRFDFTHDVRPIFARRCAGCHREGGPAPMSLLDYREARPYAVSIRERVLLGHMPPWYAEGGALPLQGETALSARELDMVLDWASGGAPEKLSSRGREEGSESGAVSGAGAAGGARGGTPAGGAPRRRPGGLDQDAPDSLETVSIPLGPFTLPAGAERVSASAEVVVPGSGVRYLRSWKYVPGDRRTVRALIVWCGEARGAAACAPDLQWELPEGSALTLEGGMPLAVEVRLGRTWKLEPGPLRESGRLELRFASEPPSRIARSLPLRPGRIDLPPGSRWLEIFPFPEKGPVAVHGGGGPSAGSPALPLFASRSVPSDWPRSYRFTPPYPRPRALHVEAPEPPPEGVLGVLFYDLPAGIPRGDLSKSAGPEEPRPGGETDGDGEESE